MNEFYELKVAGLTRKLPVVPISSGLKIASFNILGDTRLVRRCAKDIYKHPRFPKYDVDIIICPEAKTIPLAQSLSELLKVNYVVIRKTIKSYMQNPLVEPVKSMTTTEEQKLVIDGIDAKKIKGRNVVILDDVFSTGGTIRSIEKLLAQVGCNVVAKACILLEEAGYEDPELIYLERLPVFK